MTPSIRPSARARRPGSPSDALAALALGPLREALLDLARGEAGREVGDEGVRDLVEECRVEVGRERGSQAADRDPDPAVVVVVLAAGPRRCAGRVVVAARGEEDDRDRRRRLVVEGDLQRRVVPFQHAEDLAPDVFVRLAVVAHVKVGEASLLETALLGALAAKPLEHRRGLRVGATVEVGGQHLDRLARPVLADERVRERPRGRAVAGHEAEDGAGRRFDPGPVPGVSADREDPAAHVDAPGRDGRGTLEEGGRFREASGRPLAHRARREGGLQKAPRLLRVSREEVLGHADVLGPDRLPRVDARGESGRGVAVLRDGTRRGHQVVDLGGRGGGRFGLDGRRRPERLVQRSRGRRPPGPRPPARASPAGLRGSSAMRRRRSGAPREGRWARAARRRGPPEAGRPTARAAPRRVGRRSSLAAWPWRAPLRTGGTRARRRRRGRSVDSPCLVPWPATDGACIVAGRPVTGCERKRDLGSRSGAAHGAGEGRVGKDARAGGRRPDEAGDGARRRRGDDAGLRLPPRDLARPADDPEGQHLLAPAVPVLEQHAVADRGRRADAARRRVPGPPRPSQPDGRHGRPQGRRAEQVRGCLPPVRRAHRGQLRSRTAGGSASSRRRSCSSSTASSARCGCPR